MTLPPVSFELVRRLEHAALRFSVARLEAIRDRPETGLDLRIKRFGAAIAPASPAQPELDFVNRIEGLGTADVARLDQILDFYGSLGIDPWLELTPEAGVEELGALLARAGARIVDFHAVLYGLPRRAPSGAVDVRRTDEAEAAARLLLEGHAVPEGLLATHGSALAAAVERAGGCLYVATVGGVRAAAAALTVADGIGYLANAATLAAFRHRGSRAHSSPRASPTPRTAAAIWSPPGPSSARPASAISNGQGSAWRIRNRCFGSPLGPDERGHAERSCGTATRPRTRVISAGALDVDYEHGSLAI